MGLLSRIGGRMMGAMRGAGGMADNAIGASDNMAMGGARAPMMGGGMGAPPTSPQAQAFVERLQQRVAELQQQPYLPPRLRTELNENIDLLRRIQAGGTTLS